MEIKSYNFNGRRIPSMQYAVSVPETFEGEKMPMVVCLHGAGERGTDPAKLWVHGFGRCLGRGEKLPALMLLPQCPENLIWNHLTFELKELIDAVAAEYGVDTDRISITGLSMGGFGTWEMGMSYPGFFSALAPICGGGTSWRVSLIGKTPVWAFHGDADAVVPVTNSLDMCEKLKSVGGSVDLTLLHGVGHDSWTFACERTGLLLWLISKRRSEIG